eukprot:gene13311-17833_t
MSSSILEEKRLFIKYQGLGNDFIIVNNMKSSQPIYTPEEAIKLCNRNFGIGGDGLIFAMPGENGCEYTMRIYNSDGSEPQMCGNGIRCLARFIKDEIKESMNSYKIWTKAGVIIPTMNGDGTVTVDMGLPILNPPDIPTLLKPTVDGKAIDSELIANGKSYFSTAVSMGNPHSVIFVDDFNTMDPPFETIGPIIEAHPMFPQKVNAEFVQVKSRNHVVMKVWERGAGPTLACGTGACAVVVAGVLSDRTDRNCIVTLPGGDLRIHWNEADNKVYMTGPAEEVFGGAINPKLLK